MARKAKNPPVEVKDKDIDTVEDSEEVLFGEEDLENSGLRELLDKGRKDAPRRVDHFSY